MIKSEVRGHLETVAGFRAAAGSVRKDTVLAVTRMAVMLQRHVKEKKLSGQVLKVRTGLLRRSITYRVVDSGSNVYGVVGTNVKYGRIHEYGGTVTVGEHLRTITQAFGRRLKEPVQATVRRHAAYYPERSFLRTSLDEMMPTIREELRRAAVGSINKSRGRG